MKRVGRSTVRTIYWGTMLSLFIVFMVAVPIVVSINGESSSPREQPLLTVLASVFWLWVLLGRPVARLLVPLFVSTISCPGCGEEVETVQVWDCACGFHDFRERNVLTARCPLCGSTAGHIDCPRCNCSIGLW